MHSPLADVAKRTILIRKAFQCALSAQLLRVQLGFTNRYGKYAKRLSNQSMAGSAARAVLLPAAAVLVLLAAPFVAAQAIIPADPENSSTAEGTNDASIGSSACCAQLRALNFSSNIPVMIVQLAHTEQMAGKVTPAQAQLLAKGPYMPGSMCTCGAAPGEEFKETLLHVWTIKPNGKGSLAVRGAGEPAVSDFESE
jgi:hypothetical protein